jgi:hypothetical protein
MIKNEAVARVFLPGFDVLVTDEGAANVSTLFFGSCEQSNHLRRVAANLAHFVPSWQFLDSYHIESKYFVFNSHALSSAGFERSSCSTPDHPHFPAAVITAKKTSEAGRLLVYHCSAILGSPNWKLSSVLVWNACFLSNFGRLHLIPDEYSVDKALSSPPFEHGRSSTLPMSWEKYHLLRGSYIRVQALPSVIDLLDGG